MLVPTSALLITARPDVRDAVVLHAAGIQVMVRAPDRIASCAWIRVPVVLIDNHAARAVAELGLPHRPNLHLLADDDVQPHVWLNAMRLNVERVLVLPDAFPALEETVRTAGHPIPLVAVAPRPGETARHESEGFQRFGRAPQ